jgi:hypothetical protein
MAVALTMDSIPTIQTKVCLVDLVGRPRLGRVCRVVVALSILALVGAVASVLVTRSRLVAVAQLIQAGALARSALARVCPPSLARQ